MKQCDPQIIIKQTFNRSVKDVWKAISDVKQMRLWFFDNIPDFKAQVGFETRFNIKSGDRNFLHLWKIIEVEPLKKIVYNWKYDGYSGDSFVVFELVGQGNKTDLRLTHQVVEDFPRDIPEFSVESCKAGWTFFINQNLKRYLEK